MCHCREETVPAMKSSKLLLESAAPPCVQQMQMMWWRRNVRIPAEIPVTVQVPAGVYSGSVRDASPEGSFLRTDAPVEVGQECQLHMFTQHGAIVLKGAVVRTTSDGFGLRLARLARDEEARLKRVLEEG